MPAIRSRHKVVERDVDSDGRPTAMHADQFVDPRDRRRLLRPELAHSNGNGDGDDYDSEEDATTMRLEREWRALSLKTKLLGPILFVVGCACLGVYGMYQGGVIDLPRAVERGTSTALVVVGSMSAAAGGWSCFVMAQVWRREPGYAYSMIPGE